MTSSATPAGLFIALEGADGSGKTSMHKYLADRLEFFGVPLVRTRELGGTPVAEKLRNLITGADPVTKGEMVDKHTRMLMVLASRIQHIKNVIHPGVAAGKVVLSDRCFDSTYVYQGVKDGLVDMLTMLENMSEIRYLGFRPDYTIFLDVSPEKSWERTSQERGKDETMNEGDFAERQADIATYRDRMYQASVAKPDSIYHIDADRPIEEVQQALNAFALHLSQVVQLKQESPAEEAVA